MALIMPEGTFHDEVLFMMVVRPIRCCLGIAIGARVFVDVHRNCGSTPSRRSQCGPRLRRRPSQWAP